MFCYPSGDKLHIGHWYNYGPVDTFARYLKMKGYNVGMNMGICAGQTIMWPHIHFIPRHKNDAPEIGGMRHAHPGADHRKMY